MSPTLVDIPETGFLAELKRAVARRPSIRRELPPSVREVWEAALRDTRFAGLELICTTYYRPLLPLLNGSAGQAERGVVWLHWAPDPATDHLQMRYTLLHELAHQCESEEVSYTTVAEWHEAEDAAEERMLRLCVELGLDPVPYRPLVETQLLLNRYDAEWLYAFTTGALGVDWHELARIAWDVASVDAAFDALTLDELQVLRAGHGEPALYDLFLRFNRAAFRRHWLPLNHAAPISNIAEQNAAEQEVQTVEVWVGHDKGDASRMASYAVWGDDPASLCVPPVLRAFGSAITRSPNWSLACIDGILHDDVICGVVLSGIDNLRTIFATVTRAMADMHTDVPAGMWWERYGSPDTGPALYRCAIWYELPETPRTIDLWIVVPMRAGRVRTLERALRRFAAEWFTRAALTLHDDVVVDGAIVRAHLTRSAILLRWYREHPEVVARWEGWLAASLAGYQHDFIAELAAR
jgi:hypothetical protein